MNLSRRLVYVMFVVTLLTSVSVSWISISTLNADGYRHIDSELASLVSVGLGSPLKALNNVLADVNVNHIDVTLDVVTPDTPMTQVQMSTVPYQGDPSLALARSVEFAPRKVGAFELRSVSIGDGAYVVIAASTAAVDSATRQLAEHLLLVFLIVASLATVLGRLLITRDLRRVVGTLEASLRRERESMEEMQRFFNDASHELRTPLTSIRGYAEVASATSTSEGTSKALGVIADASRQLNDLLDDLLMLARLGEVRQHEQEVIDLEIVSASQVNLFEERTGRVVSFERSEPVRIVADEELVMRILKNAFSNIERYVPNDAPIQVRIEVGDRVVLTIDDGGPGIPSTELGVPPKRFQRFDRSRARASGGTGLGMSIMYEAAVAIGATMVTAQSPLGGLRIQFSFPRA